MIQKFILFVVGVAEIIGRTKEVRLYERLNEQLSSENSFLKLQLIEANDQCGILKDQLDTQLGINKVQEQSNTADFQSVGGIDSFSKRANKLSAQSYLKAVEDLKK